MGNKITMGNDEFILYIRKWHPNCKTSTQVLGKSIWIWLKEKKATKLKEQPQHAYWVKAEKVEIEMLPEHATQFEFERSLLPELYKFLDELGKKI
ncbi:MAG: hypothetical protein PHI36_01920 [Bacteroidales bacterium]|nr:hypothetical protein [Bacteroidales bacterium]